MCRQDAGASTKKGGGSSASSRQEIKMTGSGKHSKGGEEKDNKNTAACAEDKKETIAKREAWAAANWDDWEREWKIWREGYDYPSEEDVRKKGGNAMRKEPENEGMLTDSKGPAKKRRSQKQMKERSRRSRSRTCQESAKEARRMSTRFHQQAK